MLWDMIRKIKTQYGTTIFLTTHYLEEADQLSDTICIMKNGKEIIQGPPQSLKAYTNQNIVNLHLFLVQYCIIYIHHLLHHIKHLFF